jgi:eukaryotic-like serine/threonine-protein kinase
MPRRAWMSLDLFSAMNDENLKDLLGHLEEVTFNPDDIIVKEGDVGDSLYLLEKGSVRVQVRSDGDEEAFLSTLSAPAVFGEMALLTGIPRTASVVAVEEVVCYRLQRTGFETLMEKETSLSRFMTRVVGERLLEAQTIREVGKYEITGQIGEGAAATVFSARHPELEVEVALKMLSHTLVHRKGFTRRFKDEARRVANLNHEHIVRVYDTEVAYGTHFIVMERLRGTLLEDILESQTRLAWGAIRRILKEVCLALHYSHEAGLLHRDIKPSNVFLTEDRRVKILDFGIAMATNSTSDDDGLLLGTPYYMSPEQIRGDALDARTDLYSLGVVAYELVTGDVPYEATSLQELLAHHQNTPMPDPRKLVAAIPDDLVEFIRRACSKDPNDRFDDCSKAAKFLKTASELPLVHRLELSTVAISYHPSRRKVVGNVLEELQARLDGVAGVSLLWGHQESSPEEDEKLTR